MNRLLRRMLGAARLHPDIYEEVEADRSSIGQASVVVLTATAAIGVARWLRVSDAGLSSADLAVVLFPLVLWIAGAAFSYMVGSSFFRGPETETDFAEILRTTGFAFSPAVLRIFVLLPPPALGLGIDLAAQLWVFVGVVIALRQALDFTTLRAVGTFGLATVLLWLVMWGLVFVPLPF